jgi:hypothetical protein
MEKVGESGTEAITTFLSGKFFPPNFFAPGPRKALGGPGNFDKSTTANKSDVYFYI